MDGEAETTPCGGASTLFLPVFLLGGRPRIKSGRVLVEVSVAPEKNSGAFRRIRPRERLS